MIKLIIEVKDLELDLDFLTIGKLDNINHERSLLGPNNRYLALINDLTGSEVFILDGQIKVASTISEDDKAILIDYFKEAEFLLDNNISLGEREIINIFESAKNHKLAELEEVYLRKELVTTLSNGKPIFAKTINQIEYLKALNDNDIVFAIGPAGTGKTFLGVCFASKLFKAGSAKKIVLVRPVVEAGEKLGYLPGDLKEKIDPYLVPLYDALDLCFGHDHVTKLMDKGIIEVCPLAYMRGRTLDNAIIILDEAQNATQTQMKMFLTRLGFNSKMIITGDITQIDLPYKTKSGLVEAGEILANIKGIAMVKFDKADVMRHPLVYRIVDRYEKNNNVLKEE